MIEANKISKKFRHQVLEDVNFSLRRKETCVLLGPNGAGKTTFLKILSSIILPDAGMVYIDGQEADGKNFKPKAITGAVFSNKRTFYQRLTGTENLKFFSGFYDIEKNDFQKRINHYTNTIGFPEDLLTVPVQDYSSGQIQMLSFIRMLLTNPAYMFIDEPFVSLDIERKKRIYSLIKQEVSNGKGALIVTHSYEEAKRLNSKMYLLKHGRITNIES